MKTITLTNREKTIRNHIESLLVIAMNRGIYMRRPSLKMTPDILSEFSNAVEFHLKSLDDLDCSWKIQNRALNYFNNMENQTLYESLFKQSMETLVTEIVKPEVVIN